MKKIFFTILFLLSGFSLMAEIPQNQPNYIMPENSVSIGVGGSTASIDTGVKVDTKSNLNISYLRKVDWFNHIDALNGKLSIGADFTTFFGSTTKVKTLSGFSSQNSNVDNGSRNRVFVDSNYCTAVNSLKPGWCDTSNGYINDSQYCSTMVFDWACDQTTGLVNCSIAQASYCDANKPSPNYGGNGGNGGGNGGFTSATLNFTGNSYTFMVLSDYEFYRNVDMKVDVSAQLGLGMVYRTLSISGSVKDSGGGAAMASKLGVVGNYTIINNLAVGLGVHYVYTGESSMKLAKLSNADLTQESNSAINYNIQLRYMF
ncbi:MAG: hypothetical protein LBQ34_04015 [Alphaproteobacteria bacterium]|jgi:hypothetical protein|nr:hypothetical protein [Alphaproteobacteria bacterium]